MFSLLALAPVSVLTAKVETSQDSFNQYLEGRYSESIGDSEKAVAIYAKALKEQPDNADIASRAYVQAVLTGDFALSIKALKTLQTLGRLEPDMPLVLFGDAFASRDFRRAEQALIELEALGNFDFLRPYLAAWLSAARGQNASAILKRSDVSQNGSFYFDEQKTLLTFASSKRKNAAEYARQNLKDGDSRAAPLRIIVARHLLSLGEDETARAILSPPRTGPESRLLKSLEAGQIKSQRAEISAASGLAFLFRRLSSDLALQNADFPALSMAQIADRIEPDSDQGKLALGKAYLTLKKTEAARRSLSDISDASPYYLVAINTEASALITTKKYNEAKILLDDAIGKSPEAPELPIILGQTLQASGDLKGAASAFTKAIELAEVQNYGKPALANYYLLLGAAQDEADMWPAARESLEKANAILPDNANILNYLGYTQIERRENIIAATAAIERAYELQPQSAAITDSLGWSHFLLGDHEKAVTLLEKALAGQPQDPTINEHLGDAYWTVGREYEARYAWKNARLLADESEQGRLDTKISEGLRAELISP